MAFGKDTPPEVGRNTQFKPGVSGNPDGKPKGTKHISTWVQELLSDETFTARILDSKMGIKDFQGAPVKAIIEVAIVHALNGDQRWAKWLSDNGWGTKVDITTLGESINPYSSLTTEELRKLAGK